MHEFNSSHTKESVSFECLEDQVAFDLSHYISTFSNRSVGQKKISVKTGLNEKTLRRLLKKENIPSNQTLYKLYSVLTDSHTREELLQKVPPKVKEQLESYQNDAYEKIVPKGYDLKNIFKKDPISIEIYLLLATRDIEMSHILYHYGQYGVRVLEVLVESGIAVKLSSRLYALNPKQQHLDPDILKAMGIRMTDTFFKCDKADLEGSNFIGLYCEGLNEKGKKKWLEIDKRAFNEKLKVTQDPENLGSEPVFTFQVTEDFESPEEKRYEN